QKLHKCVKKDDANELVEKMLSADSIVLATPVYFYSMDAQLKALIDRTVVVYPNLTNKRFYYLLTMADTDRTKFDGSLAALRGFLDCYEGSKESCMVCADGVYELDAIDGTKFLAEAKNLGTRIK
ncbi:MAG: NAD(P)H-dependent oxidoreductase, partial [Kiritimatiellae bacterium]|nr:NAD(P)H-dependent oxidoreductase [Kiritimatiellia bacterium]